MGGFINNIEDTYKVSNKVLSEEIDNSIYTYDYNYKDFIPPVCNYYKEDKHGLSCCDKIEEGCIVCDCKSMKDNKCIPIVSIKKNSEEEHIIIYNNDATIIAERAAYDDQEKMYIDDIENAFLKLGSRHKRNKMKDLITEYDGITYSKSDGYNPIHIGNNIKWIKNKLNEYNVKKKPEDWDELITLLQERKQRWKDHTDIKTGIWTEEEFNKWVDNMGYSINGIFKYKDMIFGETSINPTEILGSRYFIKSGKKCLNENNDEVDSYIYMNNATKDGLITGLINDINDININKLINGVSDKLPKCISKRAPVGLYDDTCKESSYALQLNSTDKRCMYETKYVEAGHIEGFDNINNNNNNNGNKICNCNFRLYLFLFFMFILLLIINFKFL